MNHDRFEIYGLYFLVLKFKRQENFPTIISILTDLEIYTDIFPQLQVSIHVCVFILVYTKLIFMVCTD